jgi:hypothetical protein
MKSPVVVGCDVSKKHDGPFFSVSAIAYQVGRGVFPKGKKRKLRHYRFGRFCKACLESRPLRFHGRLFFVANAADPAGDF